jgi:hypothetical protein
VNFNHPIPLRNALEALFQVDDNYRSLKQLNVNTIRQNNKDIYWVLIWYFCNEKLPYEFFIPYEEKALSNDFYRDYMTYTYGGPNINTPEDKGALMVNFCLYPGTYQPSGHMNLSRAREFFIQIASSYASASTPVDLIVMAAAINFLLISDGSAVLRYST